jgi:DNA-binding MarR family transcriptional regulator
VGNVPDDTELGRLLTQLLRLVSPAGDGQVSGGAAGNGDSALAAAGDHAVGRDALAPVPGPRAAGGRAGDGGAPAAGIPQVTGSEARALIELVKARGIAQGELAGLLGLEKSTVSRLAAGLERKGWVRRGRDEGNQRYVRLYLTAEGGAVASRLWDAWQSRQARILAALTDEERAGLSSGLRGLVRGLAAEGLLGQVPPVRQAPDSPPAQSSPVQSPPADAAASAPPAGRPREG